MRLRDFHVEFLSTIYEGYEYRGKVGSIRIFSFKGGVSRDIDEKLEAETRDFLYDVVQGQHDGFENDAGGSGRFATRTVWI